MRVEAVQLPVYVVSIGYSIQLAGKEVDYHVEHEYYNTLGEATEAAKRHRKGEIEGEYSGGEVAVCDGAEVEDDPQMIDF